MTAGERRAGGAAGTRGAARLLRLHGRCSALDAFQRYDSRMFEFPLKFRRLDRVPVSRLLGGIGVYALWAKGNEGHATYLGEGWLLERLPKHIKRWGRRLTGVVPYCLERQKY